MLNLKTLSGALSELRNIRPEPGALYPRIRWRKLRNQYKFYAYPMLPSGAVSPDPNWQFGIAQVSRYLSLFTHSSLDGKKLSALHNLRLLKEHRDDTWANLTGKNLSVSFAQIDDTLIVQCYECRDNGWNAWDLVASTGWNAVAAPLHGVEVDTIKDLDQIINVMNVLKKQGPMEVTAFQQLSDDGIGDALRINGFIKREWAELGTEFALTDLGQAQLPT